MLIVPRDGSRQTGGWRRRSRRLALRCVLPVFSIAVGLGVACSDDDPAGECIGGGGPVAGENENHCVEGGMPIANMIGACMSAGDAGEEEEEEHATLFGNEADDDECKYHVRFENTCVVLNEPVTFTLELTRLIDDAPGSGASPTNLEIYLADNASHVSPSNDITAREGPPGTYEIGPVVFDRAGRWVVRFHYFDTCSEVPEDSPHSHAAFYIDVP